MSNDLQELGDRLSFMLGSKSAAALIKVCLKVRSSRSSPRPGTTRHQWTRHWTYAGRSQSPNTEDEVMPGKKGSAHSSLGSGHLLPPVKV